MCIDVKPWGALLEATQAALAWGRQAGTARPAVAWVAVAFMSAGCASCDAPPTYTTRPLPQLVWETPTLPDYGPLAGSADLRWRQGVKAAREPLQRPAALETQLDGEERDRWEQALAAMLRYQSLSDSLRDVVTQRWVELSPCEPPGGEDALPQWWRVEAQRLRQLHRAALWHLGHLEMEALGLHRLLRDTQAQLAAEQSNLIHSALLAPLAQVQRDLEAQDQPATRPDGDWLTGALRPRLARHRPLHRMVDLLEEAITRWQPLVEADKTWSHLTHALEPHLRAARRWQRHHRKLLRTFDAMSREHRAFARVAAPIPSTAATTPALALQRCFALHAHQASLGAQAMSVTLNMQRELAATLGHVRWLRHHLPQSSAPRRADWLPAGLDALATLQGDLEAKAAALMHLESAIAERLDRALQGLWAAVPDLTTPALTPSPIADGTAAAWRQQFFALKRQPLPKLTAPEPAQPLRKRNKPHPPYVSRVLDLYRADAAVAHIEQGLLAISELDAHIARLRAALTPHCADACADLPDPLTPHSPRQGPYVQLWSGLTPDQRHLGHYLLVLELTRLHLARQTDTLTTLHAWIADRSALDGAWPPLASIDETWDLYTGPDGTYARFLKKWSDLQRSLTTAHLPDDDRTLSPAFAALLTTQAALTALTIDFARLSDRDQDPPIPLDTLLSTWHSLDATFTHLEALTIARDQAEAAAAQPPPPTPANKPPQPQPQPQPQPKPKPKPR